MKYGTALLALCIFLPLAVSAAPGSAAAAEEHDYYLLSQPFDKLTQAERTAAKRTAKTKPIPPLVACADPGNMPFSNDQGEGYWNRIIKLLADEMDTTVSFYWRPYYERGLTRSTLNRWRCDLLLGMPVNYHGILTTLPIFRTTYIFAYRKDSGIDIDSLDDPELEKLEVGVFQHSGLRTALMLHGIKDVAIHEITYNADVKPQNQPWRQVQAVVQGELDIAGVWGPFAGYAKAKKGAPIVLQPANLMSDKIPLEFSLAIGMRQDNVVLKYALDMALKARADDIQKILEEYGVPLVQCSECIVPGTLPSHGSYVEIFLEAARKRFLKPLDRDLVELDNSLATPDQVVTRAEVKQSLEAGVGLVEALANAVIASDFERTRFLVEKKGADINALNEQGYAPLHQAASVRDSAMIEFLLELGADPNVRDADGWTPLMHAAYRNHVPSVETLAAHGANLEAESPEGQTALTIALSHRKFWSAQALVKAGANVNHAASYEGMTPLMMVTLQDKSKTRAAHVMSGVEPVEMAEILLEHGAEVNAETYDGVTALMLAAGNNNSAIIALLLQNGANLNARDDGGDTALEIAKELRNPEAVTTLKLFGRLLPKQKTVSGDTDKEAS